MKTEQNEANSELEQELNPSYRSQLALGKQLVLTRLDEPVPSIRMKNLEENEPASSSLASSGGGPLRMALDQDAPGNLALPCASQTGTPNHNQKDS